MPRFTVLVLLAALALPPVAAADDTIPIRLRTGTALTAGQAETLTEVTFTGRHRLHVRGWLDDLCPADGYGAYLRLAVSFASGRPTILRYADTRKCSSSAPVAFELRRRFKREVTSVSAYLYEWDNDAGKTGDTKSGMANNI